MDNEQIKKQAEKIEGLYRDYSGKMSDLKKEQDKILEEFLHELEKAKIEEIKSKL